MNLQQLIAERLVKARNEAGLGASAGTAAGGPTDTEQSADARVLWFSLQVTLIPH